MAHDLQYLLDVHALREIVTKAAIALDTRQFEDWLDLCTPQVTLIFPLDPENPMICEGKEAFRKQLGVLFAYETTTHFTGNMVAQVDGDSAETETYCIAHHIQTVDDVRQNLQMSLRYKDNFVRRNGAWLMSRREMVIMWSALTAAPAP